MKTFLFLISFLFITISAFSQWEKKNTNLNSHHFGMSFIDPMNGYLVGSYLDGDLSVNMGGKILKTTDGGITWDTVLSTPEIVTRVMDIEMTSFSKAVACHRVNKTYVTSDGGMTWDTTYFNGLGAVYKEIEMVNENIGYIVGWSGQIFKTEDGGYSWQPKYGAGGFTSPLECIKCLSVDTCFAGGYNKKILKTFNGGDSWEVVRETPGSTLFVSSIFHVKDESLIAVGGNIFGTGTPGNINAVIFKSEDMGETWDSITYPTTDFSNTFTDVFFVDSLGYAIGDYATIYKSIDFGDTWELIHQDPTYNGWLREIIMFDFNKGYICGDHNTLFVMGEVPLSNSAIPSIQLNVDVFPNPFSEYIYFKSNKPIPDSKVLIFDELGRLVLERKWENSTELFIENIKWSSGIYFFKIVKENQTISQGKIFHH